MVHIITDTTSCLPSAVTANYEIPVIPQIIHFGEETFYEGRDMDVNAFMTRLRSSKALPKTSAPPPELFVEQFSHLVPLGEPIICIHPSTEVSGTVRSAYTASLDFPKADIRIIDTRVIASPLGSMVIQAARMAADGEPANSIVEHVHNMMERCRIYFLLDTLEYLMRGGRIGGAAGLLGSVLQVKPILTVKNGSVSPYERERTNKKAIARIKELVIDQISPNGDGWLTVMHADRYEDGQELAEDLKKSIRQLEIPVMDMCPAIVTHGGPGILGVGFFSQ